MEHPFARLYPRSWSRVKGTVLAHIGSTPLVNLTPWLKERTKIKGVELLAKLEGANPGGSVKDRPALSMVLDALEQGVLREGLTLLDSTSGNTGIAYAMIGSTLGFPVKLCVPASASEERLKTLLAYGAELVITDPLEGSDGAILECERIYRMNPHLYFKPDQYNNPANPRAHAYTTAPEIWEETRGRVTHAIAALGTSGTAMGLVEGFNRLGARVAVVGVEPDRPLHGIEGLKHMATSIVPGIYDESRLKEKFYVRTEDAYETLREIARSFGLLIGPSGAATLWVALELAQKIREGVFVAIIPDQGGRYLSTQVWSDLELPQMVSKGKILRSEDKTAMPLYGANRQR